jgi:4-hydroxybutyrate dehydrogenase
MTQAVTLIPYLSRIQFGAGARALLDDELRGLARARPLILTDAGVMACGALDRVLEHYMGGATATVFADVPAHPTLGVVQCALSQYRALGCDSIVAIGGGAVVDCAKGLALLSSHADASLQSYSELNGGSSRIGAVTPVIAMPTLAGAGSELSRGAGLILSDGAKHMFSSPTLIPPVAICDPELTVNAPAKLTAQAGIDALGHAVEAYLSPTFNPPADAIALDAIGRLTKWLPRAVADIADIEARTEVMIGAVEAAMTLWKGLGVAHALSIPFDAIGLPHGALIGLFLPEAVRRAMPVTSAGRLDRLAGELGCAAGDLPDRLRSLHVGIGLPPSLSAMGVTETFLSSVGPAAERTRFNATAPRPGSAADYTAIAHALYR